MEHSRSLRERRRDLILLVFVIAVAMAISAIWAIRVPIFEEPDEIAHADYAFALFDVGRPFTVVDPHLATSASRQAAFLSDASGYRAMRYNPDARVPARYGTRAFDRAIDDRAPIRSYRPPPAGAPFPYVAGLYPAAFYALEAATMALSWRVSGPSLTSAFLAARFVDVALLGITLAFSFRVFRRSGLRPRAAVLATAAVGFLPLVAWVAGYVQPDNLVAALFAAGLSAALGSRRRGTPEPARAYARIVVVGCIVTACVFVKAHYAFALWLATAPLALARVRRTARGAGVALFAGFAVAAPLVAFHLDATALNPVHAIVSPSAWVASAGALSQRGFAPGAVVWAALDAFGDAFFAGTAGLGFWLHFGVRDGTIVPARFVAASACVLAALTFGTLVLFAFAEARLARRIANVARARSRGLALRIALGAAPVNLYAVVTAMLVGIAAITRGGLVLQGRYWLPVVTALGVILFAHLPTIVKAGPRRRVRTVVTGIAAAASLGAAGFALAAMNASFYGPSARPLSDTIADVDVDDPTVRRGDAVAIAGYAVDMRTGLPARDVVLSIDGRPVRIAPVGRAVPQLATVYNDDAILRSGFDFRISTNALSPGAHVLRFFVGSDGSNGPLAFRRTVVLHVF